MHEKSYFSDVVSPRATARVRQKKERGEILFVNCWVVVFCVFYRLGLQESGLGQLHERIEALEAENGALRADLNECQPLLEMLRGDVNRGDSAPGPFALAQELAHVQRAAKTKAVMCEALTAELVATQQQVAELSSMAAVGAASSHHAAEVRFSP